MEYEEYRKAYFVDPAPTSRYRFIGTVAVTLYFEEFESAVEYYQHVLGSPAYVEGEGTRGWQVGGGWLTLLRGESGHPQNVEITLQLDTPKEAERLQAAFVAAGGHGSAPSNELMYTPVRACPVRDPFGTEWLIISALR